MFAPFNNKGKGAGRGEPRSSVSSASSSSSSGSDSSISGSSFPANRQQREEQQLHVTQQLHQKRVTEIREKTHIQDAGFTPADLQKKVVDEVAQRNAEKAYLLQKVKEKRCGTLGLKPRGRGQIARGREARVATQEDLRGAFVCRIDGDEDVREIAPQPKKFVDDSAKFGYQGKNTCTVKERDVTGNSNRELKDEAKQYADSLGKRLEEIRQLEKDTKDYHEMVNMKIKNDMAEHKEVLEKMYNEELAKYEEAQVNKSLPPVPTPGGRKSGRRTEPAKSTRRSSVSRKSTKSRGKGRDGRTIIRRTTVTRRTTRGSEGRPSGGRPSAGPRGRPSGGAPRGRPSTGGQGRGKSSAGRRVQFER